MRLLGRRRASVGGVPDSPASVVRSLADDVRARTDEELAVLLLTRPDLARPAPSDLTALAARATTRASTARAVDGLDVGHLQVLEAAVVTESPLDPDRLVAMLGGHDVARVEEILSDLWAAALLWRGRDGLVPVRTVADVLGPHPAGLGPALSDLLPGGGPPAGELGALVAGAPPRARAILDRLAWGPPVGVLPGPATDGPAGRGGIVSDGPRWLLARGLVVATAGDQVVLPREVALGLREGRLHRASRLSAPNPDVPLREPEVVDAAAGAAASELLAHVDDLLATWSTSPPRVLRGGGLAARTLVATARDLDVDEPRAALVVEVAYAAGLVEDDAEADPVWAPTAAYDRWRDEPGGERWAALAAGWLGSTRAAHLVGERGREGRAVNALGPDAHWPPVAGLRRSVLAVLDSLPAGAAPDASAVVEILAWRRPRRLPRDAERLVVALLSEAATLGVTGRGALSTAGRALLLAGRRAQADDAPSPATAMHPHLPAPVERILLQADLTAVAPGPVAGALADLLRLVADLESRGGATVHRFSEPSIRRALDAGWSADQVLGSLAEASTTPVPQPLDYLVRDVARRHGQVRVGSVRSYIRADAPSTLDEMLASRELAPLQLRRIAPSVLVSPVAPEIALDLLRDGGFAPAAESPSGVVAVARTPVRRTAARRGPAALDVRAVDSGHADDLVRSLRAGEAAAGALAARRADRAGPAIPANDPTTSVAVLREAIADGHATWLGYSDGTGHIQRMLFYPERIDGGRVTGTADGATRTLSVHRITGVVAE